MSIIHVFHIEFSLILSYNTLKQLLTQLIIDNLRRIYIMAYVINDDCISCGACAAGCPVEAISEGAAHYEINADVCVDCGACAGTCPVGAPNPQ